MASHDEVATRQPRRKGGLSPAALRAALRRSLPDVLAEVLLPTVHWRAGARGITAVLPNPIWESVFREHCQEPLQRLADEQGLELRVICHDHAVDQDAGREPSFDNFLQDPGNQFALSACRRVLEAPGIEHNPLYLHGPSGCGKTHLLRALGSEFRDLLGPDQVVFLAGPEWVAHQAQELAEHGPTALRKRLEEAPVLLFDEVDALATRTLAQEQLFHLINECLDNGQQIVLSGSAAPRRLHLEERLATRLGWGLEVAIEMPLVETRLALLKRLTRGMDEELDAAELAVLVETQAPDMHHVARLAELIRRGERVGTSDGKASFDRVLECVAARYGIRPTDIAGKRRHRRIALARQTALLLGRRLTGHSLEALGGMVGGRDHSTVLYSIRQAEERLGEDPAFAREVAELTQQVLAGTERQRQRRR